MEPQEHLVQEQMLEPQGMEGTLEILAPLVLTALLEMLVAQVTLGIQHPLG
jgi:hypothetical protein